MKKIGVNIFSDMLSTSLGMFAPLLVIPILVKSLGVNDYGSYVTYLSVSALIIVVADLGFNMFLPKEISMCRDSKSQVRSLVSFFVFSKLIVGSLGSVFIFFYVDGKTAIRLTIALYTFFQIFNPTPILNGIEEYKFTAKLQLFSKLLLVALVFFLDFSSDGLEKALLIQCVSCAVFDSVAFVYFFKKGILKQVIKIELAFFIDTLSKSLSFYFARLMTNAYQQSSTYFVSLLLPPSSVALYSIAVQLYKVGQAVIGSVSKVIYVSIAYNKDYNLLKKVTLISMVIYGVIWFPILLTGKLILSLIFSFDPSKLYILSLVLYGALFFTIISSYWGYPALTAINKQNYAHLGIFVSSISYFLCFGCMVFLGMKSLILLVFCLFFSEMVGAIMRVFFARRFNLL